MKEGLGINMTIIENVFGMWLTWLDWKISIEFYIAYSTLDELIRINKSKNLDYAMYGNRN